MSPERDEMRGSSGGPDLPRDFLLEVGVEEIPARYLPGAVEELNEKAREAFLNSRIAYGALETFGTPRRLVLYAHDVHPLTRPVEVKVRGPSKRVAYDQSGAPTRALLGFCKSQGISVDQVVVEADRSGEYVYALKVDPGIPVAKALRETLPGVVLGLTCPRPLRWNGHRFFRPIRWVVCLYGEDVVPVEIAGVRAGRTTWGHRTLHPGSRDIRSAGEYFAVVRDMGVIPSIAERRDIIRRRARDAAASAGGHPIKDDALLEEVTCLAEHPAPFLGSFEPEFLVLPVEVLSTVMKHHQRFFPVEDSSGKLLPHFVGVRDGDPVQGIQTVREGNEWVLRARLEDAAFFYREDLKVPLSERLESLKGVYFLRGAGTLYDKTQRLEKIVVYLADELKLPEDERERARLASKLSKCDLTTAMVRELPELEGVMGGHYAESQGYPRDVCRTLSCQYLPRGVGDPLPDQGIPSLVALADKLDTLAVAFALGISPSGSQDPYGLRRFGSGVVAIIIGHRMRIDLDRTLEFCLGLAEEAVPSPKENARDELKAFIASRLETHLSEKGFKVEIIRTVAGGALRDPASALERAKALSEFVMLPLFGDLIVGYRRSSVLAKNARSTRISRDLLSEPAEIALYDELERKEAAGRLLFQKGNFRGYLEFLASLRSAIDRCLDEVLIMTDDEKLRENRLALLNRVSALFSLYGDFSHVLPLETA